MNQATTEDPRRFLPLRVATYACVPWAKIDLSALHQRLESKLWAPWLQASLQSLQLRSALYPAEQLALVDHRNNPVASLSLARISWDGDPATLPTWDAIAVDAKTGLSSYDTAVCSPRGNTLVAMSMNVKPELQGKGLARQLLGEAQKLARQTGAEHLIGSFRPSDYGKTKLEARSTGRTPPSFLDYCRLERADGKPFDGWLRVLSSMGMQMMREDSQAMRVDVAGDEFQMHASLYNPKRWILIGKTDQQQVWECGEVGTWTVNTSHDGIFYQESNIWGRLPF